MTRVPNPQPGNRYKLKWQDRDGKWHEKEFLLVNSTGNSYEVVVDGKPKTIGNFSVLCPPYAGEVHDE